MEGNIRKIVTDVVAKTPVVDMHTHIYSENFGKLLLWGVDELVTYHYLVTKTCRCRTDISPRKLYSMKKTDRADLIWDELFIKRSPISEACRGVVTTLSKLGLDPSDRDLSRMRKWFAGQKVSDYIDRVFELAGLKYVVMTNDPFDSLENPVWKKHDPVDQRFKPALRIDALLVAYRQTLKDLQSWGYKVDVALTRSCLGEMKRFIEDQCDLMQPVYMAASLPPDMVYPAMDDFNTIMDNVILPVCRERGIPFATMIGVNKLTNPELLVAGDSVGKADIKSVQGLVSRNPDVKFLVTMLSRENQHELCVTARKFPNLMIFGCWWYLNDPSIIREMTAERLELLGLTFIPQHSDARVLDQVIYKWTHSRQLIGDVLSDKYEDLERAGWTATREEIQRDVLRLFEGNFETFCGI